MILSFLLAGSFTWAAPYAVTLKNATGDTVGMAALTAADHGVKIALDINKLPPGEHAIHFNEKGACVGPKFESAGGHFAPGSKIHGFDAEGGHHAGDMKNIVVPADGKLKIEIINHEVSLDKKAANSLFKKGGTALVIHESPDDYKSQPAGNAGARIACGVIK